MERFAVLGGSGRAGNDPDRHRGVACSGELPESAALVNAGGRDGLCTTERVDEDSGGGKRASGASGEVTDRDGHGSYAELNQRSFLSEHLAPTQFKVAPLGAQRKAYFIGIDMTARKHAKSPDPCSTRAEVK